MDELEVTAVARGGCQVVAVSGDLDSDTAPRLDAVLDERSPSSPVVVDLTEVEVLTSAGVQSLLRDRSWGRPALVCPDGRVALILEIVQAQLVVPIYRRLDAALVALGRPRGQLSP